MARNPAHWFAVLACLTASLSLLTTVAHADDRGKQEFNAVDGVAHELMVAVGDNGSIVHFPAGETPRRVPSGTDRDLLGVHVVASDYAVAVGRGIVLLWNGAVWRSIVTGEGTAQFSRVWASPDRQLLLYGEKVGDGQRICPWIPDAGLQPFCRHFLAGMLGACGDGEEIYLLLANGDIQHLNNALIDAEGNFAPAFSPVKPLDLAVAWLPEETCQPPAGLPQALAVQSNGDLVHFDGAMWRVVRDAVPTIALAHKVPLRDLNDESRE